MLPLPLTMPLLPLTPLHTHCPAALSPAARVGFTCYTSPGVTCSCLPAALGCCSASAFYHSSHHLHCLPALHAGTPACLDACRFTSHTALPASTSCLHRAISDTWDLSSLPAHASAEEIFVSLPATAWGSRLPVHTSTSLPMEWAITSAWVLGVILHACLHLPPPVCHHLCTHHHHQSLHTYQISTTCFILEGTSLPANSHNCSPARLGFHLHLPYLLTLPVAASLTATTFTS